MIEEAQRLYSLPPGEFVVARKALVSELKGAGRNDDADTVGKLQKPSVVEHALNAAAWAHPELLQRWAKAARTAIEAQSAAIGGGGAGDLRQATAELRAVTNEVVDGAIEATGDESKRPALLSMIRQLTTVGGITLLAAGVLGSVDPDTDEDLFTGAPIPPPRPESTKETRAKPEKAERAAVKERPQPVEKGPTKAELAQRERAERRRRAAEDAVHEAESAVRRAEAEVRGAKDAAAKAATRLERAERDLRLAHTKLDDRRAGLRTLDS